MRAAGVARLLALPALLAVAAEAGAHQFEHPKVLRIGLKADRLLLQLGFDLNPGPESQRARAMFDLDADGRLDPEEQAKIERFLEETALLFLRVEVDGRAVRPERLELAPNHLDRPQASSETLGITAVYQLLLPATPPGATLRLDVHDRDRDRTRHVPLVIDLGPGWRVAFASQGELHPSTRRLERIRLSEGAPLALRLRRDP